MDKKYTIRQLEVILTYVEVVEVNHYSIIKKIVNYLNSFPTTKVLEHFWGDNFKNENIEHYPFKLKEADFWATYSNCVKVDFSFEKGKLIGHVRLFNGDIMDGYPTTLKFSTKISFPKSFLHEIKDNLQYTLKQKMNQEYDIYLSKLRTQWMNNFESKLLGEKVLLFM